MNRTYTLPTRIAAWMIKQYFWFVVKTSRLTIKGLNPFRRALETVHSDAAQPVIVAAWHNKLFLLPLIAQYLPSDVFATAIISKSRDGDLPAALAESFSRVSVIRIGHKSRRRALYEMVVALKKKMVLHITPDGPRGPCYEVKPGVVYAAQQAQALVFPFTWTATSTISFASWDRFQLPCPFSKIEIQFKEPLRFQDKESLDDGCRRLKQALEN